MDSEKAHDDQATMAPARRLQEEIKHGFLWLARILHSSRRSLPFENRIGVWPPRALPSVETTIDFSIREQTFYQKLEPCSELHAGGELGVTAA